MISVLGSGFGLYGHLPALVELGHDVAVPARYRTGFDARTELADYASSVQFIEDEAKLVQLSKAVVLARRPADNEAMAYRILREQGPRVLVIEKPPAPTPKAARRLATSLRDSGVRYSVPYLLLQCGWADEARCALHSGRASEVGMDWVFHSPTVTADSWKASSEAGGGPLNYYFIHVIALAVFLLGEDVVIEENWRRAGETGVEVGLKATNGRCRFAASFRTDNACSSCSVTLDSTVIFSAETPFGAVPRRGERDPRIEILKRFYRDAVFHTPAPRDPVRDACVIDIWEQMA